jgi:3-methyladenine DNA glycosylase AlkD
MIATPAERPDMSSAPHPGSHPGSDPSSRPSSRPGSPPAQPLRRSPITLRANELVADRRPMAEALGQELGDLVSDPDRFVRRLSSGLRGLADAEYESGQRRIAPGIGAIFGVRWPLLAAVQRGLRQATRSDRIGAQHLALVERLFREPELEHRWIAFGLLERLVVVDPERSWQLLRRASREAGDWITVDSLAHPVGRGILTEPYRWAELEQLVYAPSRWERRLVGSAIATIPFVDHRLGRDPDVARRAIPIVGELIGDAEPDVQKALGWALRSLVLIDPAAVTAFVQREASTAHAMGDGNRAWVLRDVLVKLDPSTGQAVRETLAGIRRKPGASPTSSAAATAAAFAELPLGRALAEAPLI